MARTMTAEAIAEKQINRTSAAIPDVEAGIRAVTESPTIKAAANLDKAVAGFQRAVASGKMARNLRAVTLPDWQEKTLAKVSRISEGVNASRAIIVAFHGQRASHQVKIDHDLDAIPNRTLEDGIRRATVQIRGMAGFSFDRSKR